MIADVAAGIILAFVFLFSCYRADKFEQARDVPWLTLAGLFLPLAFIVGSWYSEAQPAQAGPLAADQALLSAD